jgi:hypothetical protein
MILAGEAMHEERKCKLNNRRRACRGCNKVVCERRRRRIKVGSWGGRRSGRRSDRDIAVRPLATDMRIGPPHQILMNRRDTRASSRQSRGRQTASSKTKSERRGLS